jgi:L-cysteate sulfo-lyase
MASLPTGGPPTGGLPAVPRPAGIRLGAVDALAPLRDIPRLLLAHLPTPLEPMVRLGAALGVASLWVKRDDCTGLGLGGNKVRKLEFDLAAAQASGADCVVSGGVAQSNHARQVAAACALLGLDCHLGIMSGRVPNPEPAYHTNGNILLDRLYGAVIHPVAWNEDRNAPLRGIAAALSAAGRTPYLVPYGASDALGAMGYVLAAEEIVTQCPDVAWIVHASGSAGTQAGLLAGLLALGHPAQVVGIDVDAQAERVARDVRRVGREAAAMLGVGAQWDDARVEVAGEWCGPAYGVPDASTDEAIRLAARLEALALDPVYAGKGLAGLIGLARAGRFAGAASIVWIHTGGVPGLFAHPEVMARAAGG